MKTAAEDVVTVQDRTVPVEQEVEEGGGRSPETRQPCQGIRR